MKKITVNFYNQLGDKPNITDKKVHTVDLIAQDLNTGLPQRCFNICDEIERDLKINHVYYCFTDVREI